MLRLVYRSYGGENVKNRPEYYSKRLALLSFLRAWDRVRAESELIFVNDGPVAPEILGLQQSAGRVVELPSVGLRRSYLYGLHLPELLGWADDDLVWYSEDDYLYRPDALAGLIAAAAAIPSADYFALYGFIHGEPLDDDMPPRPRGWRPSVAASVDGVRWERVLSTTSSFGGRAAAITADLGVFRFCMVPHRHMFRDHDTGVLLQGFEPYPYRHLARSVAVREGRPLRRWARDVALLPFLVGSNLRAHRRLDRRRLFVAAVPNLATHLEADKLSPGTDWAAQAADVEAWADARAGRSSSGRLVHLGAGARRAGPTPTAGPGPATRTQRRVS